MINLKTQTWNILPNHSCQCNRFWLRRPFILPSGVPGLILHIQLERLKTSYFCFQLLISIPFPNQGRRRFVPDVSVVGLYHLISTSSRPKTQTPIEVEMLKAGLICPTSDFCSGFLLLKHLGLKITHQLVLHYRLKFEKSRWIMILYCRHNKLKI